MAVNNSNSGAGILISLIDTQGSVVAGNNEIGIELSLTDAHSMQRVADSGTTRLPRGLVLVVSLLACLPI